MPTMCPELHWAVVAAVMTSVLWVPHIIQRIAEMGPYAAFRDPRHDQPTRAPWAQRAIRAHSNAIENLAVFAPLALAVQVLGLSGTTTIVAAKGYVVARAAHYIVYVLGVPWLRTPIYLVGFICQCVLAARILGAG